MSQQLRRLTPIVLLALVPLVTACAPTTQARGVGKSGFLDDYSGL